MELKTPKEVVDFIAKENIQVVDFRFMDFPGLWQHFSIPSREVDEQLFEDGLGFDGSSIRGWQAINESDMLVKPVAETAFVDPFLHAKTLVINCNIFFSSRVEGISILSHSDFVNLFCLRSKNVLHFMVTKILLR